MHANRSSFLRPLLFLAIVLWALPAWGDQGEARVLRDLGPEKTLGVCSVQVAPKPLSGGIVDALIDAARLNRAYAEEITASFRGIFEKALAGAGGFQLLPATRLVSETNGKPLNPVDCARANALFACVKSESGFGVKAGFSKPVKVKTYWQLVGPSGWTVELETEVVSEETFGVSPDTQDPSLKPVFLRLARHTVRLFLEKLNKIMEAAGSAARLTIADPDEVPVETLTDPGRLPQPEPGCALNSNGKWQKRVALPGGAEIALVYVPEGRFLMGSTGVDEEESQPQHEVTIATGFWLGKYEVTQAQWKVVLGSRPSKFKGDNFPVENVSWDDAKRFLAALNEQLGLGRDAAFRLPTEAEWEYAARAGSPANYSFSDSAEDLGQHAWFDKNAKGTTHPVGGLRANPWGLYDMYGNVLEWCEDAWHDTYENAPIDGGAWRGEDSDRVCRGGSWDHPSIEMRSYYRGVEDQTETDKTLGFRVVLPLKSVWNLPPKTRP